MFYETETGRLQNLLLLQEVMVVESSIEKNKFCIGYIQTNGVVIEEGSYATKELANTKLQAIITELLK